MTDRSLSPFSWPLVGWGNDDLLVSDSSRAALGAADPALLAVLDWPALRAHFALHDPLSNANRVRLRWWGRVVFAVVLLGLAAGIAAQQLDKGNGWEIVALAATALAGALGLGVALGSPARSQWLLHRIWTERLRQLYFQVLLNHLPAAAAALTEEAARTDAAALPGPALLAWQQLRARALQRLEAQLGGNEAYGIERLVTDRAEMQIWLESDWAKRAPIIDPSPELDRLVGLLGTQRIGIQVEYVQKKLREGLSSPVTQRNWIRFMALLFSLVAVCVGLAAIPLVLFSASLFKPMILAQALCASIVVLVNTFDKGMAVTDDAVRYEWYLAALEHHGSSFTHAQDINDKVAALRALETTSYVEMRRFFVSHKSVRTFS